MSIKKIAEITGASVSTVSRVLNNPNYHCSSEELREKIWDVAREINYTPNVEARNLKMGLKSTENSKLYINVLITRVDIDKSDPFFVELLHVIESEIHKKQCILNKVWYHSVFVEDNPCTNVNLEGIVEKMFAETEGKSDGLVIIGKCNKDALIYLKDHCKNIVSVNRNSTNYKVDEVTCDGAKIASMAIDYLVKLGHKRIGYIGKCYNEVRYRGFLDTLAKYHMEPRLNDVVETNITEQDGYDTMKRFCQQEDGPTAIYCANDIIAVGMLKYLKSTRKKKYIPSIISSDGIEKGYKFTPQLTTVRIPKEDMGRLAVMLLLDRINGGHDSVARVELNGTLFSGESCKRLYDDGQWYGYSI